MEKLSGLDLAAKVGKRLGELRYKESQLKALQEKKARDYQERGAVGSEEKLDEETDFNDEAEKFFEEESATVLALELGQNDLGFHDAIKIFPDGTIMWRHMESEEPEEIGGGTYHFITKQEAKDLLEKSVKKDEAAMKEVAERKESVRKSLERLG